MSSNEPVPDFFTPSFFTVGPDGNVSSIASSDYLPNTTTQDGQGFKLFDSSVVHDFLTRGGIDAGDGAFTDLYVLRDLNNGGANARTFVRQLLLGNNPAADGGDLSLDKRQGAVTWVLTPSTALPPAGFTTRWTATGPPVVAESLVTTGAYAGAGYAALAPVVQVSIPAGMYDVEVESYHIGGAAPAFSATSWSGPGVVASDTNGAVPTLVANQRLHQTRRRDNLQLQAGVYSMEFRSPSAVAITWGARALRIYPRAVFF